MPWLMSGLTISHAAVWCLASMAACQLNAAACIIPHALPCTCCAWWCSVDATALRSLSASRPVIKLCPACLAAQAPRGGR